MLKSLKTNHFTNLPNRHIHFVPGLNVLIGENGTGKSHVMKLGYACLKMSRLLSAGQGNKAKNQKDLANILLHIFGVESVGKLNAKKQGLNRTEITADFAIPDAGLAFGFSARSSTDINLLTDPVSFVQNAPVFIPPKELLTFTSWLPGLYGNYEISVDETYIDCCKFLMLPLLKGFKAEQGREVLKGIEQVIGGRIILEENIFYFKGPNGSGNLDAALLSEGYRKLGMLSYLLLNGAVSEDSTLFWDEPEANLNPNLLKHIANWLVILASKNYQIIIATHSLNLIKEIHIAGKQYPDAPLKYFSLVNSGTEILLHEATSLTGIGEITSLEADLELENRFVL